MSTDQADIDLIEQYLNGKLKGTGLRDFEFRLDDDRELARKLRLRKTFPSLFKAEGTDAIVMSTAEVPEPAIKKGKRNFINARVIVWGAIIIVLAGAFSYFILIGQDQPLLKAETRPHSPVKATPEVSKAQLPVSRTRPEPAITVHQPVELDTPPDNKVFSRKEEILFRWKQETDSFTNFYIFSEDNRKLAWWRGIRPGIREYKVAARNFKPGKFYWYVGTKKNRRSIIISN